MHERSGSPAAVALPLHVNEGRSNEAVTNTHTSSHAPAYVQPIGVRKQADEVHGPPARASNNAFIAELSREEVDIMEPRAEGHVFQKL